MKMYWKPFTATARKKQLETGYPIVTTFRKGDKWLEAANVGQPVEFVDETDESTFATGTIIAVKACAFKDIAWIDHKRQSSDMTPVDRLKIMQKVYGEDYNDETLTTVVTIRVN